MYKIGYDNPNHRQHGDYLRAVDRWLGLSLILVIYVGFTIPWLSNLNSPLPGQIVAYFFTFLFVWASVAFFVNIVSAVKTIYDVVKTVVSFIGNYFLGKRL